MHTFFNSKIYVYKYSWLFPAIAQFPNDFLVNQCNYMLAHLRTFLTTKMDVKTKEISGRYNTGTK